MKTAVDGAAELSRRFLAELFSGSALHEVDFRLWDGTRWPDNTHRRATLVLKHPGALRQMFEAGSEKALAEAYLRDEFDIEGDIESAFEIVDALAGSLGWKKMLSLTYLLHRLPHESRPAVPRTAAVGHSGPLHSLQRDQEAVSFHYDVSNDFYRLWLDRQMVYSCAYFERPDADLDTAQAAKLDFLCRKLRLKPGQTLLDIGCGWGGLAIHAARNYGVAVTGITLSENQAEFARERVVDAGLQEQVSIQLRDYRDLRPGQPFDAIVSVGMSEHVGREKLPGYFDAAQAMLKPGGAFLNHAIGEGCRYRPSRDASFIDEYVFPDADIAPLRSVVDAAESSGFEVRDVENLREHYARTLRAWVQRLEGQHEEALAFVNEPTYRVWRLYLAGSAHGFAHGRLAVYQVLLANPLPNGDAGLPLTRHDWYR